MSIVILATVGKIQRDERAEIHNGMQDAPS